MFCLLGVKNSAAVLSVSLLDTHRSCSQQALRECGESLALVKKGRSDRQTDVDYRGLC